MLFTLLVLFAMTSSVICIEVLDFPLKTCEINETDFSTCTFSGIMDSYEFHRDLNRISSENTTNITAIKFIDSFMDNIPKELFLAYLNLTSLDASNVELERLESYDLLPGSPLISLNVSNNKIAKLGARILGNLKDLVSLDASHNHIERINPTTFTLSETFKYLNLSHNKIVKVSETFLAPLRNLELLRLDHNLIEEMSGNFEEFQPKWKELYLQHNKLVVLDPTLFKSVAVLDLSLNNIEEARFKDSKMIDLRISENLLSILMISKSLETLSASGNNENSLHISFEDNKSLKYLDLSESNLKGKEETFSYLKNFKQLEHLDLTDTQFDLDSSHLKGLSALKTLLLGGSINRQIQSKSFVDLKSLEKLDISENTLASFDLNELKNSKNLQTLSMGSSKISQMKGWKNISALLPNLKEIDIYKNEFNCRELLDIVDEFRRLKLQISELDENGEQEYLRQSCVEKHSQFPETHSISDDVSNEISKYVVGFIAISLVFVGIIFANRKFDILHRLLDLVRCNSSYPPSSLLREEM